MRRGPSPVHAGNRGGKDSQRSTQEHTTPASKHACCSTKALALRHGAPRGWLNQMTRAGATQVLDRGHVRIRGHPPRRREVGTMQNASRKNPLHHIILLPDSRFSCTDRHRELCRSGVPFHPTGRSWNVRKKERTHASPEND